MPDAKTQPQPTRYSDAHFNQSMDGIATALQYVADKFNSAKGETIGNIKWKFRLGPFRYQEATPSSYTITEHDKIAVTELKDIIKILKDEDERKNPQRLYEIKLRLNSAFKQAGFLSLHDEKAGVTYRQYLQEQKEAIHNLYQIYSPSIRAEEKALDSCIYWQSVALSVFVGATATAGYFTHQQRAENMKPAAGLVSADNSALLKDMQHLKKGAVLDKVA